MSVLAWIIGSGLAMACIALSGGLLAMMVSEGLLRRMIMPLVALAAGSLLGGAFFHMLPEASRVLGSGAALYFTVLMGFLTFFVLEAFLHWHHCHKTPSEHHEPFTYLILIADGIHNLIGGLNVGAAFVLDLRMGITMWLVAAAHEVPQELGDFGALIHGGFSKKRALLTNFLSGLTFVIGGLLAYGLSTHLNTTYFVAFGAGNFIYIAAADLIPRIHRQARLSETVLNFVALCAGLVLLYAITLLHG